MKKIIVAIFVCLIISGLTACGGKTNPNQPSDSSSNQNTESTNQSSTITSGNKNQDLPQNLDFIGYSISYPSNGSVRNSNYGKSISCGSEYFLLVEAPASAGESFTVNNLDEAIRKCEPYIYKSLESKLKHLFSSGNTKQNIKTTSAEVVNGIEMEKVIGTFLNTSTNKEMNYVAYYFLSDVMSYFLSESAGDVYPVYFVCIDTGADNSSVEGFMDNIVKSINQEK